MAYVIIERQRDVDLAIEYPTIAAAQAALTDSPYIEAWCKEDALDAYAVETIPADQAAKIISPVKTFAVTVYVQADSEEQAEWEVKDVFENLEQSRQDRLEVTVEDVQPIVHDEAEL